MFGRKKAQEIAKEEMEEKLKAGKKRSS